MKFKELLFEKYKNSLHFIRVTLGVFSLLKQFIGNSVFSFNLRILKSRMSGLWLFAIQYLNGFCKGGGDNLELYRNATVEPKHMSDSVQDTDYIANYCIAILF